MDRIEGISFHLNVCVCVCKCFSFSEWNERLALSSYRLNHFQFYLGDDKMCILNRNIGVASWNFCFILNSMTFRIAFHAHNIFACGQFLGFQIDCKVICVFFVSYNVYILCTLTYLMSLKITKQAGNYRPYQFHIQFSSKFRFLISILKIFFWIICNSFQICIFLIKSKEHGHSFWNGFDFHMNIFFNHHIVCFF